MLCVTDFCRFALERGTHTVGVHYSVSVPSVADGYLHCFWRVAAKNTVATDVLTNVLRRTRVCVCFEIYPGKNGEARGNFTSQFSSHQQCRSTPGFPGPHPHLILYLFGGCGVASHFGFNLYFPGGYHPVSVLF